MYVAREVADRYQEFFNFMSNEHGLILTISEIDEILREANKLVNKLNERNSVDEGEKSLPHTCACGNEKKSWYKTCDKCWYKEKSQ